jgi:hypothetical protein
MKTGLLCEAPFLALGGVLAAGDGGWNVAM